MMATPRRLAVRLAKGRDGEDGHRKSAFYTTSASGSRERKAKMTNVNKNVPRTRVSEVTVLRRWSSGQHAGLWYPRSRVRSRPKPSDFSGEKIHSIPSLGGGSKAVSHVADLRGMSKNPGFTWKPKSQAKLTGHFSPVIPSFADRGLSCRLHVEAPRGESGNV